MKDWPAPAREELERILADHHARLVGTGVDADEVVADLRRHVETELGSGGTRTIDPADVRESLQRLLPGDDGAPRADSVAPPDAPRRHPHLVGSVAPAGEWRDSLRLRRAVLHWLFLVILPAVTLGFELVTGLCATELFDPIARVSQLLAVAAVPLAFAAILLGHDRPGWKHRHRAKRAAAALACGVCVYYAVQFAPLMPAAVIAIIFFGLGLLPMAPLLACGVAFDLLAQLRRLDRAAAGSRPRAVWPLVFVGFLALALIDLSGICASLGMRWYESNDPVVRSRGLALLRGPLVDPGDIDHPWRMSGLSSGTSAILGLVTGNSGRIWGEEFDRMQFAATGGARDLADPELWRRTRDRGRGGAARWTMLGDLALDGSRLDGRIDPDLLYGYVEWTMTLRNAERWPLEGRATLQLPPGGVVSRVTLWIDGEEREAAFAGRSAATKAYEAVAVVQRRDPILVTTAGPDRVRLRCFPVPADGRMKFRIGITYPLQLAPGGASAEVSMPSILESNFALPAALRHHLWIGRADGERIRDEEMDTRLLRGPVMNEALGRVPVSVRRDLSRTIARARSFDGTSIVEQQVRDAVGERRRVALVIDGNPRVLLEHGPVWLEGLKGEGGAAIDVWLALDQPMHRSFPTLAAARAFLAGVVDTGRVSDAEGNVVGLPSRGGFDNSQALAAALAASSESVGTVLWLHGPQVTSSGSGDAVRQAFERGRGRIDLVEQAIIPGRNDILEALDGRPEVRHLGGVSATAVRREIARATDGPAVEVVRAVRNDLDSEGGEPAESTRHLARLWAATEVGRLAASGPARQAEAAELAVKHQLVTSVSGAVVLETKAQYDAHGLQPVDPATVPTVPETGSVAVLMIALVALGAARVVQRWLRPVARSVR